MPVGPTKTPPASFQVPIIFAVVVVIAVNVLQEPLQSKVCVEAGLTVKLGAVVFCVTAKVWVSGHEPATKS